MMTLMNALTHLSEITSKAFILRRLPFNCKEGHSEWNRKFNLFKAFVYISILVASIFEKICFLRACESYELPYHISTSLLRFKSNIGKLWFFSSHVLSKSERWHLKNSSYMARLSLENVFRRFDSSFNNFEGLSFKNLLNAVQDLRKSPEFSDRGCLGGGVWVSGIKPTGSIPQIII